MSDVVYLPSQCKLTIALKQDKHDKVLLAFIKQYRALLKPVVKDIPEFCNSSTSGTSSNTNFTTPASIAKIITLEKGTTLNGQPKLEVVEVEDRWLHQIFLRYPEFKAEWNTELAQAKSDLNNNEGICFAILLYRSAARLMTIVSKRGDPLNLLTLPFPTPPETWIGALNSAIEPGRVYKTSNAEYKIEIRNTDVKA